MKQLIDEFTKKYPNTTVTHFKRRGDIILKVNGQTACNLSSKGENFFRQMEAALERANRQTLLST